MNRESTFSLRAVSRLLADSSGTSVTEMVVMSAVIGILAVPMASFLASSLKNVTRTNLQLNAQDNTRSAFDILERDFMQMNEVTLSSATFIQFRMDGYHLPAYNDLGDFDADGTNNLRDPDDDNDVTTIYAATAAWRGGYDHKDDDDDSDGNIDVQCRYYLSGTTLFRDFNYNEAGWGANLKAVLTNVSSLTFTYYGSKTENLGKFIDLGNDGAAATGDTGENDGIILQREIDWVQPAAGHGNRSGFVDTADERRYILTIYIYVAVDLNKDGKTDAKMETQLGPPLLPVKRLL